MMEATRFKVAWKEIDGASMRLLQSSDAIDDASQQFLDNKSTPLQSEIDSPTACNIMTYYPIARIHRAVEVACCQE